MNRRTLENQLLYTNLIRMVQRVVPDFDPEIIDRHLEVGEAKRQLAKKHNIHIASKREQRSSPLKEARNHLHERGIKHSRVQNFLIRHADTSDDDIDQLAYILGARPARNWKQDIARKAKIAKSAKQYAKNPNRYDIPGLDTPGSRYDMDWM